jgi:hypothetical protein
MISDRDLNVRLETSSLGLCVCGKPIYAVLYYGAVLHDLPPCAKFIELEPDEFLTYVRRSRGIPDAAAERVH